jgi:hypothetical protein
MLKVVGRTAALSISDDGALAARPGVDLRPWRVPTFVLGAVLACIVALALTTPPSATAPRVHPLALGHASRSQRASSLPITLAPAASASIGASERSFWPVRHGASLLTQGGGIHSTFTASGAALRVAQGTLSLSFAGVGRGQRLAPLAAALPSSTASRVLYRHGSVTEFYRNGPYGLEQGFNVPHRPKAGAGPLTLTLRIGGSLVPKQVGSQVVFKTHAGATALRYGQLSALDATGRRLPAHMLVRNGTLQLRIHDANARYPLRIDPFIQQGQKLVANEEIGNGQFGASVALSADGDTALIGGGSDNGGVGAVWMFTRSGTTWTQHGEKLVAIDETGDGGFGASVALSSDGKTALIGGPYDDYNHAQTCTCFGPNGAAWVFTRRGSTWTQQGEKLTGSGASSAPGVSFGHSVALSSDGKTALIGGYGQGQEYQGAAWVFTRSGSTWTQQGESFTGNAASRGSGFGLSVALSSEGNTALIGGFNVAWVFTRSGSTWTQQGETLTGSGATREFGASVALSSAGNTALIGAEHRNREVGAAWVFTRSGSTWTQQGSKLTASDESGEGSFGESVSLSRNGNTALIGGPDDNHGGAAWLFTRSGTTWTQQGSKLTASDASSTSEFGASVALSSDGNTALIGAPGDNRGASCCIGLGAAWVFVNVRQPTIRRVSPDKGPVGGGTTVTIHGTNFTGATAVKFGSTNATHLTVNSATSITAVSPAEMAGTVDVTVTTPGGTSATSSKGDFTFVAEHEHKGRGHDGHHRR